jgi:BirA family biotin operon repressor/biotin-[acetyl-CoA-carboxylase] ligase
MRFKELLERYDEVDSTMSVAHRRAAEGAPSGTCIVAHSQSLGRGRLGRSWISAPGAGIFMTAILRPSSRPDGSPLTLFGLAAGVAALEAARRLGATEARLKWPNDVVLGERKLCGVLLEAEEPWGPSPLVLAGLGLNLARRERLALPEDVAFRYVSLGDTGAMDDERGYELALTTLVDSLEEWYGRWLRDGAAPIVTAWCGADALLGTQVRAQVAGSPVVGRADGINAEGALRVITATGLVEIAAGEVTRLRSAG